MTSFEDEIRNRMSVAANINTAIAQLVAVRELLPMAEDVDRPAAEKFLRDVGIPDELTNLLMQRHTADISSNRNEAMQFDGIIDQWLEQNDPEGNLSSIIAPLF